MIEILEEVKGMSTHPVTVETREFDYLLAEVRRELGDYVYDTELSPAPDLEEAIIASYVRRIEFVLTQASANVDRATCEAAQWLPSDTVIDVSLQEEMIEIAVDDAEMDVKRLLTKMGLALLIVANSIIHIERDEYV